MDKPSIRVGLGTDTHAFQKGEFLVIGGVKIPFDKSFKAHSDGDVLLHAVCDALLGASGNKDIGTFFPDTDPVFENANSMDLLKKTVEIIHAQNWKVANIDCVITIQQPKMAPHIDAMKDNIASCLQISTEEVSVKAKTSENIGFIGRGEGASAQVVVLLYR
ncbi:MAG: 2-C-methyl-D-erythritol 2,4-cyclodiphosphate synthase [Bacteroidales bacterium]|nr:2-C-methyl-D-erythritol 2,4-cyclodiphosphate synthase [Bacteroidales bacterium]MDY0216902.1 2-C-methyl-D-erythritol 2,4-cyclodiphosphate synthase [Bacteroidales bacterium]